MAKKLKYVDDTVLHIVYSYVTEHHDWRVYWRDMGQVFDDLRGVSSWGRS